MMALIEELLPICRTIGVTGCAGRWRSCGGASARRARSGFGNAGSTGASEREWNMATSRGSFKQSTCSNFRAYSTKAIDTGAPGNRRYQRLQLVFQVGRRFRDRVQCGGPVWLLQYTSLSRGVVDVRHRRNHRAT